MKTIKIYLNRDGSLRNGLTPDFVLNQYSWQDTLLNVYVPSVVCDFENGSTGVQAMFRSYDSEGDLVETLTNNKYNFDQQYLHSELLDQYHHFEYINCLLVLLLFHQANQQLVL